MGFAIVAVSYASASGGCLPTPSAAVPSASYAGFAPLMPAVAPPMQAVAFQHPLLGVVYQHPLMPAVAVQPPPPPYPPPPMPAVDAPTRESVLFIGTQFSILYTFMYSPA